MGRSPLRTCEKNGLKKGPWTPEEDQKLIDYIQLHGYGNWRTLPLNAGLQRCGKSCRLRWTNYLRPDIKRGRFSFEEEEAIIQLHGILGNKWSAIASRLPGRTDNEIKNYWNTHIRKRLLRMGIDPVTHNPRLDLLDLSAILGSSFSSSQPNISRLLCLVNPEILHLATSLVSSSSSPETQLQNQTQTQTGGIYDQHYQPMVNPEFQDMTATTLATTATITNVPRVEVGPSDNWQRSYTSDSYNDHLHDYYPGTSSFDDHQTGNTIMDLSAAAASVFSTPSSSPTRLNSNSTLNNFNAGSSTEDERDSYCSNMLRFEMPPSILDVSNFM